MLQYKCAGEQGSLLLFSEKNTFSVADDDATTPEGFELKESSIWMQRNAYTHEI